MNRRRGLATAACVGALLAGSDPAQGFSIASGFTRSCHERLALAALGVIVAGRDLRGISLPADDLWRKVANELAPAVLASAPMTPALSEPQQFVLYSAVVGVRSPDTAGHSVSNLDQLRRAQVDPDPESQHLHCLRAPVEDGLPGDRAVVRGSEVLIRQTLVDAASSARSGARTVRVPLYLDFYGQMMVDVDEPSYLVGRALHTLQDCHAHTLRSADARTVLSVLNYVEAVSGGIDEHADGLSHSDTLDDCERAELKPVVERAALVGVAMARAAVALARDGDTSLIDRGFAACPAGAADPASCEWLHYQPGCDVEHPGAGTCCTADNDYCGSPYLAVAREKLTRPYVQEVLGCSAAGRPRSSPWPWLLLLALPLAVRVTPRRSWLAVPLLLALSATARAAPGSTGAFASVEGHLSLLSDTPGRSYIDVTAGFALRGGYRRGPWGVLGQVERNYWLPTELSNDLQPGALNVGAGVEYLAFEGRLRLSATAGPSILWFTTALDERGTVGLFVDLRPAGLRWSPLSRLGLVFDPLSVCLVAPVLGSPGIRQLEYRTLLGAELGL